MRGKREGRCDDDERENHDNENKEEHISEFHCITPLLNWVEKVINADDDSSGEG